MKYLVAVFLAACGFQATPLPAAPSDGSAAPGGGSDAGAGSQDAPDAMTAPPIDARVCFGQGVVQICLAAPPAQAVVLPGVMNPLDTSVSTSCTQIVRQAGGPELCVIAGTTVTVAASFAAIGARPLVLIGSDGITVSGTLDVSSKIAGGARKGAGANDAGCATSGNGANDSGGGGGGAGGSFGTIGGSGGVGDDNENGLPGGKATGGAPGAAQPTPAVLRGGCKGGSGGDGANTPASQHGGAGGDGGGAVYLIAGNLIAISGDVFASGAGGSVAAGVAGFEQGAGGGGSGGMIGLDAPVIQVQGRIAANGGAGGGGGGNVGGGLGGDGATTAWDKRAPGGKGDKSGGAGSLAGDGADGTALNGTTSLNGTLGDAAGGGGAGGLGLVWTWGALQGGAMISPAPVQR
ncbi:MAG TPA: hypothetical protein VFT22_39435 [Kofleriaceae bacterium]|nr:hypothetical protein [Kofleriaceae bacterium]